MKCPKCGYNSFEIHDTCKKCASDLSGYKETHGLKPIVLPQESRTSMAERLMADMPQEDHAEAAAVPADMFSFDTPVDVSSASGISSSQDDPFSFDEAVASPVPGNREYSFAEVQKSAQAQADDDAFSDLLESSPRPPQPAAAAGTREPSDLDDFSWDDTPEKSPGDAAASEDDFNNLFGDTDESAKK